MRRKDLPNLAIRAFLLALICAVVRDAGAAAPGATLRAISVSSSASATQLQLRIEGDFTYQALLATPDTLFIDITNASVDRIAKSGEWTGGLLTSYRLVQFTDATHRPVVRVHVEMKHHEAYQTERNRGGLRITFGDVSTAASATGTGQTAPAPPATETAKVAGNPQPPKPSAGPVEVSALFVSAGPEGEVHVDVDTAQPIPFRVLRLENPRRLVVDLNGAQKGFHQSSFSVPSPLANGVRVGQFQVKNPSVVRVVVDLSGDPIFDVHAQPGGIRIELKPRLVAGRSTGVSPVAAMHGQDAHATSAMHGQDAHATSVMHGQDAHATSVTKPAALADTKEIENAAPKHNAMASPADAKADSTTVDALPADKRPADYLKALPAGTEAREVAASPSLASTEPVPEAVAAANAARVLAGSSARNEGSAAEPVETQAAAQTSVSAVAPEQPHYSGEPISVNLKDVDLKDFFRLIHEISGLNIIVDPNVSGSVTMVLDNVPWDQALDIVLKDNGLSKTLEGNVLRIAKLETLASEQEVVSKLTSARAQAEPLVTRFIPLSYAKAMDIAGLLKTVAGGGALSSRGTAVVDNRTNTVIVTDVASQIPVVSAFVQKLDTKSKQVSIEARVIVATKHFERDLLSALNYGQFNPSGSVVTGGTTGTGSSATGNIPTTIPTPPGQTRVTLGQTSASGFGAFILSNEGARYFINAAIAAAENRADAKTLSNPMIITQNNIQGKVLQGVQIPIQTTINLTVSIQYVNAALQLQVTPQVTADGNVFLNIIVDNSTVGSVLTQAGPSINTQHAETQVLVPDGGTVVFGGITVNSVNTSAQYVPWIGNIPIIGHLFKNSQHITDNNELLFFVTPKILPG